MACTSASSPALPSPRALPAPAPPSRPESSSSDTRLQPLQRGPRAGAASAAGARGHRRAGGAGGGAGGGGEHRPHLGKSLSPHSPGDAAREFRRGARALRDARDRLHQLHEKAAAGEWGAGEAREAAARAAQLLREVERLQRIVAELPRREAPDASTARLVMQYEPALAHEMRMPHPSVVLAPAHALAGPGALRSKSEMELSRRLSESLDMQERLAADNAALDGKRYVLYKELMCKEQRLDTARAQAARLRAELKLLARDNARLAQAAAQAQAPSPVAPDTEQRSECDSEAGGEPSPNHADLEKQLCELEAEVRGVRAEMAESKQARELKRMTEGACRGGGGRNTCCEASPGMPPLPPMQKICGVCPPCPAVCNPEAPPTPAEREAARLTLQLKQTEDSFKAKVAECAMLRADVLRRKEEAERERCLAREAQARLRDLEIRFEGLNMQVNNQIGTKEQAFEQELSVRTLKQCYREAREEVDELRGLLTEQSTQLQDYRVKYLQAQQLSEEQKRQMTVLDMDNTRISEQINLEIQRVKIKFQEKLQELAPVPDLLKATQRRLQDAQQAQALAEHHAEQLARELNCAREKDERDPHGGEGALQRQAAAREDGGVREAGRRGGPHAQRRLARHRARQPARRHRTQVHADLGGGAGEAAGRQPRAGSHRREGAPGAARPHALPDQEAARELRAGAEPRARAADAGAPAAPQGLRGRRRGGCGRAHGLRLPLLLRGEVARGTPSDLYTVCCSR